MSVYAETCVINKPLLKVELSVALNLLKHDLGDRLSTSNMQTVLSKLTPSAAFPNLANLLKCIQITLTIPVTSASCERSFSAMKLIKTYLRNRAGDDRLSDLTVLFAHTNRLVDRAKLIETRRRVQFD